MSLYTDEVRNVIHRPQPYRGMRMAVADNGDSLTLMVDATAFGEFSDRQRQELGLWLSETLHTINVTLGIPCGFETVERIR